tara:strand:+ start:514 stop:801 length:288 start_codon:yes stop_codon:yes gene_type:complete
MAKKEKIVDLKSKPEKVTDNQLERIQKTVNSINASTLEIGRIELQKHEISHRIAGFKDELILLQDELQKEYGTTDVDLRDGTINYPENGEANKKD